MGGSSPRMTIEVVAPALFPRRAWPGLLRPAQALERLPHGEHAEVVEAAADDLDADREAVGIIAAIDRQRRILRHVPRHGIGDVLERFCGIVERGGELGAKLHDRRDW